MPTLPSSQHDTQHTYIIPGMQKQWCFWSLSPSCTCEFLYHGYITIDTCPVDTCPIHSRPIRSRPIDSLHPLAPDQITPRWLTPNQLTSNWLTPNRLTPNQLALNRITRNWLTSNQRIHNVAYNDTWGLSVSSVYSSTTEGVQSTLSLLVPGKYGLGFSCVLANRDTYNNTMFSLV